MFKVIVAGSRDFNNYEVLKARLDTILNKKAEIVIVSGGARGADSLGERYALERNLPCKIFPANWELHGKSTGYKRNAEMAEYADALVAFWDGESKGTGHMIDLAEKKRIQIRVVKV